MNAALVLMGKRVACPDRTASAAWRGTVGTPAATEGGLATILVK
jgi:hypothetical protein